MKHPATSALHTLFQPLQLGDIKIANRIVMAPLTRDRAGAGRTPTALMAEYYAQRADAGLIIAEATQISSEGQGYLDTPGIHSDAQVKGWRRVTDAVHARGGKMVLQLWHVGRISHTSLQLGSKAPVAPSAIRANAKTFTAKGFEPVSAPRALGAGELPRLIAEYRYAAARAMDAGFDGVEVHAANGYLIDQFLRDGANHREDAWGGSIENRTRLLYEVLSAVSSTVGGGRTGVRLSPVTPAGDLRDSNPQPLFERAVARLAPLELAYIHMIEGATAGARDFAPFDFEALHRRFPGSWMVNNGYTASMAAEAIEQGRADLVAFGRPFIANPDFVQRLRIGAPLNTLNQATLYGGGAEGYTDYRTYASG
jgi:N-ethylmaleimide reductase